MSAEEQMYREDVNISNIIKSIEVLNKTNSGVHR